MQNLPDDSVFFFPDSIESYLIDSKKLSLEDKAIVEAHYNHSLDWLISSLKVSENKKLPI